MYRWYQSMDAFGRGDDYPSITLRGYQSPKNDYNLSKITTGNYHLSQITLKIFTSLIPQGIIIP